MWEARNAASQRSLALLPHSKTPHQALLAELLKVTNGVSAMGTKGELYSTIYARVGGSC